MMDTVRVKFLRGTSLGNGSDAAPGDVVDLDRRLLAQFAQQGRVVEVADTEQAVVGVPAAHVDGGPLTVPAAPLRKGKRNA